VTGMVAQPLVDTGSSGEESLDLAEVSVTTRGCLVRAAGTNAGERLPTVYLGRPQVGERRCRAGRAASGSRGPRDLSRPQ
jgi:hypothetical protein